MRARLSLGQCLSRRSVLSRPFGNSSFRQLPCYGTRAFYICWQDGAWGSRYTRWSFRLNRALHSCWVAVITALASLLCPNHIVQSRFTGIIPSGMGISMGVCGRSTWSSIVLFQHIKLPDLFLNPRFIWARFPYSPVSNIKPAHRRFCGWG